MNGGARCLWALRMEPVLRHTSAPRILRRLLDFWKKSAHLWVTFRKWVVKIGEDCNRLSKYIHSFKKPPLQECVQRSCIYRRCSSRHVTGRSRPSSKTSPTHTTLEITAGLTSLSHNSLRAERRDFIHLLCKVVQGNMNNVNDSKTPSNGE